MDEELPRSMETGWAKFGDKPAKVWVSRDGLSLFGEEIPRKCPLFSLILLKTDLVPRKLYRSIMHG